MVGPPTTPTRLQVVVGDRPQPLPTLGAEVWRTAKASAGCQEQQQKKQQKHPHRRHHYHRRRHPSLPADLLLQAMASTWALQPQQRHFRRGVARSAQTAWRSAATQLAVQPEHHQRAD